MWSRFFLRNKPLVEAVGAVGATVVGATAVGAVTAGALIKYDDYEWKKNQEAEWKLRDAESEIKSKYALERGLLELNQQMTREMNAPRNRK